MQLSFSFKIGDYEFELAQNYVLGHVLPKLLLDQYVSYGDNTYLNTIGYVTDRPAILNLASNTCTYIDLDKDVMLDDMGKDLMDKGLEAGLQELDMFWQSILALEQVESQQNVNLLDALPTLYRFEIGRAVFITRLLSVLPEYGIQEQVKGKRRDQTYSLVSDTYMAIV